MSKPDRTSNSHIIETRPVLPVKDLVVFPGVMTPLEVSGAAAITLIDAVNRKSPARLVLATQKRSDTEDPTPDDLYPLGIEVEIVQMRRLSGARRGVIVKGIERRLIGTYARLSPYLEADVTSVDETNTTGTAVEGGALALADALKRLIVAAPDIPNEATTLVDGLLSEPARLADIAAAYLPLPTVQRLAFLEELDVGARITKVLAGVQHRLQVLELKQEIDSHVMEEMSKQQREVVLRKQMKAIQEELGEAGEGDASVDEFDEKIKAAKMPPEVEKAARKQLSRLRSQQPGSAEYMVGRTYLEWLVDVPWSKRSEDKLDIEAARAILEADHFGLEKPKKRVLEYLAVRKLNPQKRGPILALVGPPGVGKTSLAKSVARALGRKLERISLGGVRDEAEIRGHRRTYVGALPGRIVQALKRAGTKNPVLILDELDKLGADHRGDPSAALLEVLDPEQNNSFTDHYLEQPLDLSEVVFVATANDLGAVPDALRDRLEVIQLPGYTHAEKRAIAERHLVAKQLGEHGITTEHAKIGGDALDELIDNYTREAGVRNLEREIAAVVRGVAVKVASGETFVPEVRAVDIAGYLGPARFSHEVAESAELREPGVSTGLAWTPTGGEILFIEASLMPGHGKLVITGQLGDVMKESAQAALSYVRSRAATWGIAPEVFEKSDIHIHVPAGGTPKDGPSAGNALVSALVSVLTGRRVRADVAMTGEITLRGAVLPVGGIQSKVLAAHRAGITRVILPERNRRDLADVPADVRAELDVVFVKRIEETLAAALEPTAQVAVGLPPVPLIPPLAAATLQRRAA